MRTLSFVIAVTALLMMAGCGSCTARNTNLPPVIGSFTAVPLKGYAPLDVAFLVGASDPDGDALRYRWSFEGNGGTEDFTLTTTVPSAGYTYTAAGSFVATVRVEDGRGGAAEKSLLVQVSQYTLPKIALEAWPTSGTKPLTVQFAVVPLAVNRGSWLESYRWDLDGDGMFEAVTYSPTSTRFTTYTTVGRFTATVIAVDSEGFTAPASTNVFSMLSVAPLFTYTTVGTASGLAVMGSTLYLADGAAGLKVFDITNSMAPRMKGRYDDPWSQWNLRLFGTPEDYRNVTILGTYALLADGIFGFSLLDLTAPYTPSFLTGMFLTGANVVDAAALDAGSKIYAYLADILGYNLRVVEIDKTTHSATMVSGTTLYGPPQGLYLSPPVLYVAEGIGGLYLYDVGVPQRPSILGSILTTDARGVWAQGTYAYVADGAGGLKVIDVSFFTTPTVVGFTTTTYAQGLFVSGSTAYVADGPGGLAIIDVSTPSAPMAVGVTTTTNALRVVGSSTFAFVADDIDLTTADVSVPSTPQVADVYRTTGIQHEADLTGTWPTGPVIAYLAVGKAGMDVLDITNPSAPVFLGASPITGDTRGVSAEGGLAAAAAITSVSILDVSQPMTPTVLGHWEDQSVLQNLRGYKGIALSAGRAYVCDSYGGGLYILDAGSNPTSPVLLGRYSPFLAQDVFVDGNTAYLFGVPVTPPARLDILDVSLPSTPVLLGAFTEPSNVWVPRGVTVAVNPMDGRRYAYLADYELKIVDVQDLSLPVWVGTFTSTSSLMGVSVSGRYAFAVSNTGDLYVVDISNPALPSLAGEANGLGPLGSVKALGSLFVAPPVMGIIGN